MMIIKHNPPTVMYFSSYTFKVFSRFSIQDLSNYATEYDF